MKLVLYTDRTLVKLCVKQYFYTECKTAKELLPMATKTTMSEGTTKDASRRQLQLNSVAALKLLYDIKQTNFDESFSDRYWRTEAAYVIENDVLQTNYQAYIDDQKRMGRPQDMFKETFMFSYESDKSCQEICQEGQRVCLRRRHVLGHTGSGVHLVRHYDILTRYMAQQSIVAPAFVIVYKVYLGKKKPIVPRLHKDDNYVMPAFGFDCHISARLVEPKMTICEAFNCSYIYVYEHEEISSNPVKYPRQILPYAILHLEKKCPIMLESPFLAVAKHSTLSNWEVKGETRRGFRFMFSKSGLKGKYKSFSIEENDSSKSDYHTKRLKEQLKEMRTKPSGIPQPPLLQRVGSNSEKSKNIENRSPPKLNIIASSDKESTKCSPPSEKHEICPLTQFEGVNIRNIKCTFEQSKQLLSLKPKVKIKRLEMSNIKQIDQKKKRKRGRPKTKLVAVSYAEPAFDSNNETLSTTAMFQQAASINNNENTVNIRPMLDPDKISSTTGKISASETSEKSTLNDALEQDTLLKGNNPKVLNTSKTPEKTAFEKQSIHNERRTGHKNGSLESRLKKRKEIQMKKANDQQRHECLYREVEKLVGHKRNTVTSVKSVDDISVKDIHSDSGGNACFNKPSHSIGPEFRILTLQHIQRHLLKDGMQKQTIDQGSNTIKPATASCEISRESSTVIYNKAFSPVPAVSAPSALNENPSVLSAKTCNEPVTDTVKDVFVSKDPDSFSKAREERDGTVNHTTHQHCDSVNNKSKDPMTEQISTAKKNVHLVNVKSFDSKSVPFRQNNCNVEDNLRAKCHVSKENGYKKCPIAKRLPPEPDSMNVKCQHTKPVDKAVGLELHILNAPVGKDTEAQEQCQNVVLFPPKALKQVVDCNKAKDTIQSSNKRGSLCGNKVKPLKALEELSRGKQDKSEKNLQIVNTNFCLQSNDEQTPYNTSKVCNQGQETPKITETLNHKDKPSKEKVKGSTEALKITSVVSSVETRDLTKHETNNSMTPGISKVSKGKVTNSVFARNCDNKKAEDGANSTCVVSVKVKNKVNDDEMCQFNKDQTSLVLENHDSEQIIDDMKKSLVGVSACELTNTLSTDVGFGSTEHSGNDKTVKDCVKQVTNTCTPMTDSGSKPLQYVLDGNVQQVPDKIAEDVNNLTTSQNADVVGFTAKVKDTEVKNNEVAEETSRLVRPTQTPKDSNVLVRTKTTSPVQRLTETNLLKKVTLNVSKCEEELQRSSATSELSVIIDSTSFDKFSTLDVSKETNTFQPYHDIFTHSTSSVTGSEADNKQSSYCDRNEKPPSCEKSCTNFKSFLNDNPTPAKGNGDENYTRTKNSERSHPVDFTTKTEAEHLNGVLPQRSEVVQAIHNQEESFLFRCEQLIHQSLGERKYESKTYTVTSTGPINTLAKKDTIKVNKDVADRVKNVLSTKMAEAANQKRQKHLESAESKTDFVYQPVQRETGDNISLATLIDQHSDNLDSVDKYANGSRQQFHVPAIVKTEHVEPAVPHTRLLESQLPDNGNDIPLHTPDFRMDSHATDQANTTNTTTSSLRTKIQINEPPIRIKVERDDPDFDNVTQNSTFESKQTAVEKQPLISRTSGTELKVSTRGQVNSNPEGCRNAIIQTLQELSVVLQFLSDNNKFQTANDVQTAKKDENTLSDNLNVMAKIGTVWPQVKMEQVCSEKEVDCQNELKKSKIAAYKHISNTFGDNAENRALVCSTNDSQREFCKNTETAKISNTSTSNIDQLPTLFDPSGEADITSFEKFGVFPLSDKELAGACRTQADVQQIDYCSTQAKFNCTKGNVCGEKSCSVNKACLLPEKGINNLPIVAEQKKDVLSPLKKQKPGLLNRGIKQRKNMFDLKIHSSKRTNVFPKSVNSSLSNLSRSANSPTVKINKTTTPVEISSSPAADLSVVNTKLLYPDPVKSHADFNESKVAETTKLVSNTDQETSAAVKSNETGTQSNSQINACSDTVSDSISISISNANIEKKTTFSKDLKKDSKKRRKDDVGVIPFSKVMQLKREQYVKFKHGLTKSPFIDYEEVKSKLKSVEAEKYNTSKKDAICERGSRSSSAKSEGKRVARKRSRSKSSDRSTSVRHSSHDKGSFRSENNRKWKVSREPLKTVENQRIISSRSEHTLLLEDIEPTVAVKFANETSFNPTTYFKRQAISSRGNFGKTGTGYFSWKRKYQTRKDFKRESFVPGQKSQMTQATDDPFGRFAENERELPLDIDTRNSCRHYSANVFNQTDESKLANFFQCMAEKLKILQMKHETAKHYANDDRVTSNTTLPRDAYKFRDQLSAGGTNFWANTERHSENMDDLLKEHLNKHYENMTKQIRESLMKELTQSLVTTLTPGFKRIFENSPFFRNQRAPQLGAGQGNFMMQTAPFNEGFRDIKPSEQTVNETLIPPTQVSYHQSGHYPNETLPFSQSPIGTSHLMPMPDKTESVDLTERTEYGQNLQHQQQQQQQHSFINADSSYYGADYSYYGTASSQQESKRENSNGRGEDPPNGYNATMYYSSYQTMPVDNKQTVTTDQNRSLTGQSPQGHEVNDKTERIKCKDDVAANVTHAIRSIREKEESNVPSRSSREKRKLDEDHYTEKKKRRGGDYTYLSDSSSSEERPSRERKSGDKRHYEHDEFRSKYSYSEDKYKKKHYRGHHSYHDEYTSMRYKRHSERYGSPREHKRFYNSYYRTDKTYDHGRLQTSSRPYSSKFPNYRYTGETDTDYHLYKSSEKRRYISEKHYQRFDNGHRRSDSPLSRRARNKYHDVDAHRTRIKKEPLDDLLSNEHPKPIPTVCTSR